MSEWISVEDRLPENDNEVLACENNSGFVVVFYGPHSRKWRLADDMINTDGYGSAYLDGLITHWMQLPSPPKE